MSIVMRFIDRSLNFQRKYPDLKWQHCCSLAAFYTMQKLIEEAEKSPAHQAEQEVNFFGAFLEEAVRHAEKTDPLSVIQQILCIAEMLDGGRDDGLIG